MRSVCLGALMAVVSGGSVSAQAVGDASSQDLSADAQHLEEIVVTAQRRNENLQNVPIAITALTAGKLASAGVTSAQDLAILTPALQTPAQAGSLLPRLRGIGTTVIGPGIENSVAIYVDGVYEASPRASLASFTGIERIEVLKGPQGTLFGRNATGGLLQIVTRDPQAGLHGEGSVSYGNYDTLVGQLYLTGGSEEVRGAVSVRYARQGDGYGTNYAIGRDANRLDNDLALRGKLVVEPGPNTKVTFAGDYSKSNGTYPDFRALPGAPTAGDPNPPGGPFDVNSNVPTDRDLETAGGSVRLEQDFGSVGLTSISAYRWSSSLNQMDLDRTPTNAVSIFNIQKDRQFSQEVQLHSQPGSNITWILGGYYFWAENGFHPSRLVQAQTVTVTGDQKTSSLSAFGQATVPVADRLNFTAGLRFTSDLRSVDAQSVVSLPNGLVVNTVSQQTSRRFSKLTWRASLDYRPSDEVLLYASYNRGFKSGGFNVSLPGSNAYNPEVLDAYEIGMKGDFLDRRLRVNTSFFYYDYSNIQTAFFIGAAGGRVGIRNGPSATVYGADLDLNLVIAPGLQLTGGVSLIHGRFGDFPDAVQNVPLPGGGNLPGTFNARGKHLPYTAAFSGNVGLNWKHKIRSGEVFADGTLYYNDGYYPEVDNLRRVPGYAKLNATLGWTGNNGLSVQVWGRNLTNKAIPSFIGSTAAITAVSYEQPRTYGATIGLKF